MEGRRDRGRPCTRWLDVVEKVCYARLMELSNEEVMCMDKEQWRDCVNAAND